MSPSTTLTHTSQVYIYFKLAIHPEFVILMSSFMALHRYVFSPNKGRRCKYLNICVSIYILNGSLTSSAKTFILILVFLIPNSD